MSWLKKLWSLPKGSPGGDDSRQPLADWRIFKAVNSERGERAVFRVRIAKPARPDLHSLTIAVTIKWPYGGQLRPQPEINQQQLAFETALDPLSGENDNSELVQVATGLGRKEWVYYARDRDAFMQALNDRLAGHPPYPIEIEFFDDPEWTIWADLLRSLQAKTGS